jgi:hypothetical protein
VLTFHLIARHSLIKILLVNGEAEWFASKAITALLYGLVYGCCIISAIFLRFRISKLFLSTWLIISCISVFNEFVFYLESPNTYDFISSISSGQGFTNIRITLPILFLGVWQANVDNNRFSSLFLDLIYNLTLLNSAFVCIGVVFDVPVFESYPLSGRWGYSGFLARGYSVILSSIFLIDLLRKQHFNFIKVLLMVVALLCSGTKAGLLSFGFIVFIVMIKKKSIRFGIAGVGAILLVTLPKWMPWLVSFSAFWNNAYSNNGAWGVLFSLRNENVERFIDIIYLEYEVVHWFLGGNLRYENFWIEIVALDFFGFYGVIGILTFLIFYLKWLDDWGASIPLLVAFWSGSLIAAPVVYVIWGIYIEVNKQSKIKAISI